MSDAHGRTITTALFMRIGGLLIAALLPLADAGAQAPRDHDGFRNTYLHPEKASFWAWKWEQMRGGVPKAPPGGWNLPTLRTDPAALPAPANNPSMTWIGHATMLVRLAGSNILFDPIFSEYASPLHE